MAVQGGYAIDHERAIDGMVVDAQVNNSVSKVNNTEAVVPYGVAVGRDGENGFVLLDNTTVVADVVGVLRRELNKATRDGDVDGVEEGRDATVLTVGTIYVRVVGTVTAGQPAFVVIGDGSNPATVGRFSAAAGTAATAALALPNAKFVTGAADGELAALSIVTGG